MFIAEDDEKILPYLELLRNSIYEYATIELFEDAARASSGSSYVDFKRQVLKFTAAAQEYISTNLVGGAVTTYNTDCIFYAYVLAGAPSFYISSDDGATWSLIASGSQKIHNPALPFTATSTWRIKAVATTSDDMISTFGLIYSRKAKFRIVIDEQS
jgi:hypothetical protein